MWPLIFILPAAIAQSTVTVTSTQISTSFTTYTPTVTVQEDSNCACTTTCTSLNFCWNFVITWNPFFSSMISSTTTSTTNTSTTVQSTTSNIPTPSNLYTFGTLNSQSVDVDAFGNIVLVDSNNSSAAFIFNADGTLTTYGSGLNIFANFGNVIAERDINTAYGIGACSVPTMRRLHKRGGEIIIYPRQTDNAGNVYGQWITNGTRVQLSTNNSLYGFIDCLDNTLSIYDLNSNSLPAACDIENVLATTVLQAQYSQYYAAGVSKASLYTGLATCSTTSPITTSTSSSVTFTPLPNTTFLYDAGDFTSEAPLADWTNAGNLYPVFAMGVYDVGSVTVGDQPFQVLMIDGDGLDIDVVGWQLNEYGELSVYGVPYALYANSSIDYVNAPDKRATCDTDPVNLIAARYGSVIPSGAVTGTFSPDPDIGLILNDWEFIACNGSRRLQVVYEDCPIPVNCTEVNPALFLLNDDSINDAIFNAYRIFLLAEPTPVTYTAIQPTTITLPFQQTDPVLYARDILLEGQYFDFCSSELGYITTLTVTDLETTIVGTETLETTTTVSVVSYPTTTTLTISLGTTASITIISTLNTTVINTQFVTPRTFTQANVTTSSTSTSGTNTIRNTVTTETKTLTTIRHSVTTAFFSFLKRAGIEKRTQDQSLTPTQLQPYAPSIITSACSVLFSGLYDTQTNSLTTLLYITDITSTLSDNSTTYTSTVPVTLTTEYTFTGTSTSTVYTTTYLSTSASTQTNRAYSITTTTSTITATSISSILQVARIAANISTAITSTTLTTTTATKTLCDPSRFTGGMLYPGLNFTTNIRPFDNSTKYNSTLYYPDNWSGNYPELSWGNATWGQMPLAYAGGSFGFTGDCEAGVGDLNNISLSNNWASISQRVAVCPGTQYWVRVMYKWKFTKKFPYTYRDPFGFWKIKNPDKYRFDYLDVRIQNDSVATTDAAANLTAGTTVQNNSSYDALSLTANFTTGNGTGQGSEFIFLNIILGCNNNNASLQEWDVLRRNNSVTIYNIALQSSPFDNR